MSAVLRCDLERTLAAAPRPAGGGMMEAGWWMADDEWWMADGVEAARLQFPQAQRSSAEGLEWDSAALNLISSYAKPFPGRQSSYLSLTFKSSSPSPPFPFSSQSDSCSKASLTNQQKCLGAGVCIAFPVAASGLFKLTTPDCLVRAPASLPLVVK